jgi:hypothetical protein
MRNTEEAPQEDPRIRMMEELEERRQEKAERKLSNQLDIFMWFVSAIYPFIGFVWCIMFMSRDDRDKRMQGVWILLAASIGTLIWFLLLRAHFLGKIGRFIS